MTRSLRAVWLLVSMSVRVSPGQSLACLAESAGQVMQLLQPLYLAWLVDGAIHHNGDQIVVAASAFTASVGIALLLFVLGINARLLLMERVGFAFDTRIAEITATIPTLDHLESPTYLDELQALRDQQGALGGALNELLNTVRNLIYVGGTLALAAAADWRLLLVAAAGLPMVVSTRWTITWQASAEKTAAPRGRLAAHLLGLGLAPAAGAELRVFGLAEALRDRLRAATTNWRAPMVHLARQEGTVQTATIVVFFGVAGGVLAWMTRDAIDGTVTLPVLTLALMLVNRLQATSSSLVWSVRNISRMVRTSGRFVWLLDYERDTRRRYPGTVGPPATLAQGIVVDHVSYHYPGSTTDVLSDVTVTLPAGTTVAVVGENGAGKSTLVKLLTGMYQPTAGRILVDGVDLADIDLVAWRHHSTGAFQDHLRLELRALEAIGVGHLPHADNPTHVHAALAAAASTDLTRALPAGLDTQLGPAWPDGVDLSGGQWQRLAIARAMMRPHPLLLVLDEPTAALDATTEHNLFETYTHTARQAGHHGAITVLVTHRFSTVAAADLVVVLQHGRITEIGTHTELIGAGGHYAQLYGLQARGYH